MRCAVIAVLTFLSLTVHAAEHDTWPAYMKANRYKCPGPFDTLKTPRTLTLGGKTYKHTGSKLEIQKPDADSKVKLGIISAIKDNTAGTRKNLADAGAWFKKAGVEWVVVNGDIALEEMALEDVVDELGKLGMPTLLILGNSESKGSFARVYGEREAKYPLIVNGTWVRQIVADDVEFWTLPGYHDRQFVHQGAGCLYKKEDIDGLSRLASSGTAPVVLVAHGPPRGSGKAAIDLMSEKNHVGDPDMTTLIQSKAIPFGIFGHILEAGGAVVGKGLATRVPPGTPVTELYLNAGSLSADPWRLNDGSTAYGMAMILTIDGGKASYEVMKMKAQPMQ